MFSKLLHLAASLFAGFSSPDTMNPALKINVVQAPFRVTTTLDAGPGSLRAALTQANSSGQASLIEFDIPESDPGYNQTTKSWRISPASDLPVVAVPLIIDGYTQRGSCPNNNPINQPDNASLKIELSGPGNALTNPLDGVRGLVFGPGSDASVFKGLAVINFPVGVEIQSKNSCIRGMFLGIGVDGITAQLNGVSALVAATADGTCIGTDLPEDRNLIAGVGFQVEPAPIAAAAVTIQGSNTTVQGTTVGLTSLGDTLPLPVQPVAGILVDQSGGTTNLGGSTPTQTVVIATFGTNLNIVQPATGLVAGQGVLLGTTNDGLTPTFSPGGIGVILNFRHDNRAKKASVSYGEIILRDSIVAGHSKSGIVIGDEYEDAVPNVKIINTNIGIDSTGCALPNGEHGIHIVKGADTFISGCKIKHNGKNGIQFNESLRTLVEGTDLSNNKQDGTGFLCPGEQSLEQSNATPLITITGKIKADCCCSPADTPSCTCIKFAYGTNEIRP